MKSSQKTKHLKWILIGYLGFQQLIAPFIAIATEVSELYKQIANKLIPCENAALPEPNHEEYYSFYIGNKRADGILIINTDTNKKTLVNLLYPGQQLSDEEYQQENDEAQAIEIIGISRLEIEVNNIDNAADSIISQLGLKKSGDTNQNNNQTNTPTKPVNYPNPFTSETTIKYTPNSEIRIYTVSGELVKTLKTDSEGIVKWDGQNGNNNSISPGVYLIISGKNSAKAVKN